jgi:hypothetical protein
MHRLCIGVVRSKLLHGVPICTVDLIASRRSLLLVRMSHRAVAIRMLRGFRTISAVTAAARRKEAGDGWHFYGVSYRARARDVDHLRRRYWGRDDSP